MVSMDDENNDGQAIFKFMLNFAKNDKADNDSDHMMINNDNSDV